MGTKKFKEYVGFILTNAIYLEIEISNSVEHRRGCNTKWMVMSENGTKNALYLIKQKVCYKLSG